MRIVKLYAACRPFFLCIAAAGEGHQRFLSSFAACRPIHHAVNELHRNPERSSCATANAAARTATASATVFDVCQCWPIAMPVRKNVKLPRNTPSGLLRLTFISSPTIYSPYELWRLVRLISARWRDHCSTDGLPRRSARLGQRSPRCRSSARLYSGPSIDLRQSVALAALVYVDRSHQKLLEFVDGQPSKRRKDLALGCGANSQRDPVVHRSPVCAA
jgi:hypothetical protein